MCIFIFYIEIYDVFTKYKRIIYKNLLISLYLTDYLRYNLYNSSLECRISPILRCSIFNYSLLSQFLHISNKFSTHFHRILIPVNRPERPFIYIFSYSADRIPPPVGFLHFLKCKTRLLFETNGFPFGSRFLLPIFRQMVPVVFFYDRTILFLGRILCSVTFRRSTVCSPVKIFSNDSFSFSSWSSPAPIS